MISLANTGAIIKVTLDFFAFALSVTFTGSLQSIIAKKMGDDTADQMGFSNFDPFYFLTFLDIIWFIFMQIMIGRPIPIQLSAIRGPSRKLKIFLAFGARSIMYLAIATISLTLLLIMTNPLKALTDQTLSNSSLKFILAAFFGALTRANILLATFSTIRQSINFFVMHKFEKDFKFIEHADYILIFGPLLVLFFLGPFIYQAFYHLVGCLVFGIKSVCGV